MLTRLSFPGRAALRRLAPRTADEEGGFALGDLDSARSCWVAALSSEEGEEGFGAVV